MILSYFCGLLITYELIPLQFYETCLNFFRSNIESKCLENGFLRYLLEFKCMQLKKCFDSIILRFAQIHEGGIYYLALTYFLKNSNNFLTDTRKYYEKKVDLLSCKYKVAIVLCVLHLQESLKLLKDIKTKVVFTQRY